MKEKILLVNGYNDDMIKEQYATCEEYLEEVIGMQSDDDDVDEWVAEGSHHTSRCEPPTHEGLPKLSVVMRRPGIDRPDDEQGAFEHVRDLIESEHDRELIAASAAATSMNVGVAHDLTEGGATVTIADSRLSFQPGAKLDDIKRTLTIHRDAMFTDNGAEIIKGEWAGGRPPLGTRVDAGRLVKADNYDQVRTQLQMVCANNKTKAAAAGELGCARGTIDNAIEERAAMYQLPQQ